MKVIMKNNANQLISVSPRMHEWMSVWNLVLKKIY